MTKQQQRSSYGESQKSKPEPRWIIEGTGDPAIDVPTIQAAVTHAAEDQRTIYLKGEFSFGPNDSVTIGNWARIHGIDEYGNMATIHGGKFTLEVKASRADQASRSPVSIYGVRFVRPRRVAIRIWGADGLSITGCKFEGVQAIALPEDPLVFGAGILIAGKAAASKGFRIAGKVSIVDNEIDAGGGNTHERTNCIVAEVYGKHITDGIIIAGNRFRNFTAHGVDVREVIGKATIERNVIDTSVTGETSQHKGTEGILCLGAGVYLVRQNIINVAVAPLSEMPAGIRLKRHHELQTAITGATVIENNITVAEGGVGVELRGLCNQNSVSENTIVGEGRCALNLISDSESSPDSNTLALNHHS
ncbi:MAG TPA: hypothetical protein VFV34_22825, partial [Blastocatellia bacterium]|nr:hypothetical protein [Blastocatellia bacterium]